MTPPDACTLGRTVEGVITGLFDLVEKYHGKIITSQTLGYITAARAGIRWENENVAGSIVSR